MLKEKRSLVRNTAANAFAQLTAMLVGFVFMPFLVDAFGITNYGLLVLASAVSAYAVLLDFGLGAAIVRAVAATLRTGEDPAEALSATEELHKALGTALTFYTIVGLTTAAIMAVIGQLSSSLFDISGEQASIVRNMLLIGALLQLVQWPASTARHVLIGLQRYDVLAATSLLSTGLGILTTLWVLWTGEGPVAFVAVNGAAASLAMGVTVFKARRLSGIRAIRFGAASMATLKAMLAFGWAVFVIDLADVLFYQQTDRLVLGVVLGALAVAVYEASAKINGLVTYLSGLTVSAVMPLASSLDASGEHGALRSLFVRGTKYASAFIAPVSVLIVVLAKPLLVAWLGDEFAQQAGVMQVLIAPHVLVSLGVMGDVIMISRGRMGKRVPYIVAQAVGNVVLSVILVQPRFGIGIIGVAIGTAVAHLVDFPIHIRFLLKETGVTLREWLRDVTAPVYPLLLVPTAIALAASFTPLAGSLVGLAAVVVVALVAYWGLFYRFGLTEAEHEDIEMVFSAMRTGSAG